MASIFNRTNLFVIILLQALVKVSPALAHEYWIAPESFRLAPQASLRADLVNGQKFHGHALPYLPRQAPRLELWQDGKGRPVEARAGDRPAIHTSAPDGLAVLVYQSAISTVTYREWQKFEGFVEHKDLGVTRAAHDAAGYPEADFREAYTRFSKSLVAIGSAAGEDLAVGMEAELVALANPYQHEGGEAFDLPVKLIYQGTPMPDHQIEIFERAPDDSVKISTTHTDAEGIASVTVSPGHVYMLDSVILRAPAPEIAQEYEAIYETLWANLTFEVPAP